jgi:enoyl-CoA hydratase/carnithine racemase
MVVSPLLVVRPDDAPGLMLVTLNRPEKLNAITPEMHEALQQLCLELQTDAETRVVVLTGAGRAFSAGADTSTAGRSGGGAAAAGRERTLLEERLRSGQGNRTCAALDRLEQVTIAAVNGLAIGGAVAIAACCDLRLAADSAWFSLPEVDRNVAIAWNALPRLMRELGPARTKEFVMTGDRIPSAEMLRWGFVNHVVPDDEIMPRALALARRLLEKPPFILALLKSATSALAQTMVSEQIVHSDRDLLLLARRVRAEGDGSIT